MDMKFQNRRKFHRINFNGKANIEIGDESYDCCQIKNLSLTGLYIAGKFEYEQAGNCLVRFIRDGDPEKVFMQVSGKIVWGNDEGAGLQFTSMKSDHYQSLVTVLINNAELPAIILSQIPQQCPFEISSTD